MKRFQITIQKGLVIQKAEIVVIAKNLRSAEKISEELLDKMDPSAYVDSVFELA